MNTSTRDTKRQLRSDSTSDSASVLIASGHGRDIFFSYKFNKFLEKDFVKHEMFTIIATLDAMKGLPAERLTEIWEQIESVRAYKTEDYKMSNVFFINHFLKELTNCFTSDLLHAAMLGVWKAFDCLIHIKIVILYIQKMIWSKWIFLKGWNVRHHISSTHISPLAFL